MLPSVVDIFDNATGTGRRAPLLSPPSSTANRKCRCVQHRHPERPTGVEGSPPNRKSGIRNQNNRPIFNRFHFSNRKYSAISRPLIPDESASHLPLSLATVFLIETPRLKLRINHALSTTSNFLIETKWGFCIPNYQRERLFPRFPAASPLSARISVSPCLRGQSLR